MEPKVNTSAGKETAAETVARVKAARAAAGNNPDTGAPTAPTASNTSLLDALTERLSAQGKGISTSASSNIQNSINEAISGVQTAGNLTAERLQSERGREVGFAQDRASATYTTALEGRTGYATQTVALRELTDTTEKSIRDLDARYQEAILNSDAQTASTIAGLRMKKLEFLQTQEENYFKNMISMAGLEQGQGQFEAEQARLAKNAETDAEQFAQKMAQTDSQFTQNLGIQYKQLDLQSQELDIARQRNQISMAEFNLKKSELQAEKSQTAIMGTVFEEMRRVVKGGQNPEDIDATEYALNAFERYATTFPDATFENFLIASQMGQADMISTGLKAPSTSGPGFMSLVGASVVDKLSAYSPETQRRLQNVSEFEERFNPMK